MVQLVDQGVHVSASAKSPTTGMLPEEIIQHILSVVGLLDLLRCRAVCARLSLAL